ncbi:glutamate--cysteine ligase, partial [Mycobacterium simiae]
GLADRRLRAAAVSCVAIAADKAPVDLTDAMQRLLADVERGRCPGDGFSDQVIDSGIAATVSHLAQGEL